MATGKFNDLRHLGFRHFVGEHAANTHAVAMDMQHHLHRFLAVLVEKPFQDVNDELHRRVIVIQDENFIKAGLLGLGARFRDDAGAIAGSVALIVVVLSAAHRFQLNG